MFRKQEIVDLFVSKDENSYLIYNPFAINVPKLYIIEINEDKFHYNNWIIVYGFEYKAVLWTLELERRIDFLQFI